MAEVPRSDPDLTSQQSAVGRKEIRSAWHHLMSSIPDQPPIDSRQAPAIPASSPKEAIEKAMRTILTAIGEDPSRPGLLDTPARFAEALLFQTQGYHLSVVEAAHSAVFPCGAGSDDIGDHSWVVVRDLAISSTCEHHILPFTGRMHIGYLHRGHVLGLSKLKRIADVFARRLQMQERLTREIAEAVLDVLGPSGAGVAVVMECTHACMITRGVQQTDALTITQSFAGDGVAGNEHLQRLFFSLLACGQGARNSPRPCTEV